MSVRRLVVVSSALHYRRGGSIVTYGAYARELEVWADLFPAIVIAAPEGRGEPPGDHVPIARDNVVLVGFPVTGGDSVGAKLLQLAYLPSLMVRLARVLWRADAIHVRCPGNLGLLGVLLGPLFCRRRFAKYAGQWTAHPGEGFANRLQRRLLASRWWAQPVAVYGEWPDQPPHVVPVATSVLTRKEIERARRVPALARPHVPLRLLFVGRLAADKHAEAALVACDQLVRAGVPAVVRVVGDGAERRDLERLAAGLGLDADFRGAVNVADVLASYEWADALVLASESEGWPKAITEAMTFGVVSVGNDRGLTPTLLGEGRGIVVPAGDGRAAAARLRELVATPDRFREIGERASAWAARRSIDDLPADLRALLEHWWGGRLGSEPPVVFHVVDSLAVGGAERVAVVLSNELAARGHPVTLVTTRSEGPLASEVDARVDRLSLERRATLDPRGLLLLLREVRAHRPEILHAHGTALFVATIASVLPPWPKVVWHDHFGRLETDPRERPPTPYRLAARRADAVLTLTERLRVAVIETFGVDPARVHVVPNPVDPRDGRVPVPALPAGRPRLVCVANLRPEKGHADLIEAMIEVRAVVPAAHLLVVGSGGAADATALVQSARDAGLDDGVSFLGHRDDVRAILAACDLGVLASRSEGFPLALLEYGAVGLPVVATDVGAAREILDGGRAGVLVPPASPTLFAAAVLAVLADDQRRTAMARALGERVHALYSPDSVASQIEAVYRQVLTNP